MIEEDLGDAAILFLPSFLFSILSSSQLLAEILVSKLQNLYSTGEVFLPLSTGPCDDEASKLVQTKNCSKICLIYKIAAFTGVTRITFTSFGGRNTVFAASIRFHVCKYRTPQLLEIWHTL